MYENSHSKEHTVSGSSNIKYRNRQNQSIKLEIKLAVTLGEAVVITSSLNLNDDCMGVLVL